MQAMFLRILKSWDHLIHDEHGAVLKDSGIFLSRVSRLLKEVLLDMARQHYGQLDAGGDSSGVGLAYEPGNETLNQEALALFTDFHTAVEELPENLRQVVGLNWYQDFTHREVAEVMGISEPGSRRHWVSARLQLCKKLGSNPCDRFGE